jgi:hypothetical protein
MLRRDPFNNSQEVDSFSMTAIKKNKSGTVGHACNPSYSGGNDHKDYGPRLTLGRSMRPYLINKRGHKGLRA